MSIWSPEKYLQAWQFAAIAHLGQREPGSEISYIKHLGSVAMEGMTAIALEPTIEQPDLLMQCALLHDTIEDTAVTFDDVEQEFGLAVAQGVLALTKDSSLPPKKEQMHDSLTRIRQQPREIWMVKLGDRITNLKAPPHYWKPEKIQRYRQEAKLILESLGDANEYLAARLMKKIDSYQSFL